LVEDTGDEFGEFLVFTVSVDGKGVRRHGGVDCKNGTDVSLECSKWPALRWHKICFSVRSSYL
jgi:hypothetical protein